jgi:hydrogenase nickel incorporation protein HypA/HybF
MKGVQVHEAGIAASILEIAEAAASDHGDVSIQVVRLRLGEFTGVVPEALEFAFDAMKAGTRADQARLEIERIPLTGCCPACGWSGPPVEEFCLVCPACSAPVDILTGREMSVEYVEVEEVGTCQ